MNKTCKNCIWLDKCYAAQENGSCDWFVFADEESAYAELELEYEKSLEYRHELYSSLVDEQNS